MPLFNEITDAARLSSLAEIVPHLNEFVQAGDQIMMGMEYDSLYPFANTERPTGTVQAVNRNGDSVELHVMSSQGDSFIVQRNNIDPTQLWEFAPKSFENVIQRAMVSTADAATTRHESAAAAASTGTAPDDISSLRAQMAEMSAELHAQQNFSILRRA